jgi:hypothetical protein
MLAADERARALPPDRSASRALYQIAIHKGASHPGSLQMPPIALTRDEPNEPPAAPTKCSKGRRDRIDYLLNIVAPTYRLSTIFHVVSMRLSLSFHARLLTCEQNHVQDEPAQERKASHAEYPEHHPHNRIPEQRIVLGLQPELRQFRY